MKIQRMADGLIYDVHDTRPVIVAGVEVGAVDVLVSLPPATPSGTALLDILDDDAPAGKFWLDGFEKIFVPDSTRTDVP